MAFKTRSPIIWVFSNVPLQLVPAHVPRTSLRPCTSRLSDLLSLYTPVSRFVNPNGLAGDRHDARQPPGRAEGCFWRSFQSAFRFKVEGAGLRSRLRFGVVGVRGLSV